MFKITRRVGVILFLGGCALFTQQAASHGAAGEPIVHPRFSKDLADIPGKEGLVLTVEYPPGAVESMHRHNAHAFVYVLEGHIVMAVKGGKEVRLGPGDTFYEGPDDIHTVGRNASQTRRARFVVVLIKDAGAEVLVPLN